MLNKGVKYLSFYVSSNWIYRAEMLQNGTKRSHLTFTFGSQNRGPLRIMVKK